MPDFDVDFCQDRRYRVIEYVRDRYGHDAVSQIATFGTMASKAVVRDVGRVLDLPYGLCDRSPSSSRSRVSNRCRSTRRSSSNRSCAS